MGVNSLESKPVFSLKVFRPPGAIRDMVAVTHAEFNRIVVLAGVPTGQLDVRSDVRGVGGVYNLDVGPILRPRGGTVPNDLVSVHRNAGTIQIRRGTGAQFEDGFDQQIKVPGGPRAVKILDVDGDGWNDLVVVLRNLDVVLTFKNQNGTLARRGGEMPR